jgi:hypothetical protein
MTLRNEYKLLYSAESHEDGLLTAAAALETLSFSAVRHLYWSDFVVTGLKGRIARLSMNNIYLNHLFVQHFRLSPGLICICINITLYKNQFLVKRVICSM